MPEFGHGEVADRPMAAPNVRKTNDRAAANTAPARTALHSTKLGLTVSVLAAIGVPTWVMMVVSSLILMQAKRAQDEHHDDDQTDKVNDAVHVIGMLGYVPAGPAGSVEAAEHLIDTLPRPDAAVPGRELRSEFVWPVADRLVARNVPFIFSTAYSSAMPERFAGRSVLAKPFFLATLKTALARAMGA